MHSEILEEPQAVSEEIIEAQENENDTTYVTVPDEGGTWKTENNELPPAFSSTWTWVDSVTFIPNGDIEEFYLSKPKVRTRSDLISVVFGNYFVDLIGGALTGYGVDQLVAQFHTIGVNGAQSAPNPVAGYVVAFGVTFVVSTVGYGANAEVGRERKSYDLAVAALADYSGQAFLVETLYANNNGKTKYRYSVIYGNEWTNTTGSGGSFD